MGVNTSLIGINIIGIKKNYDKEKINNVQKIFNKLKEEGLFSTKLEYIESLSNEESQIICDFVKNNKRPLLLWEKKY